LWAEVDNADRKAATSSDDGGRTPAADEGALLVNTAVDSASRGRWKFISATRAPFTLKTQSAVSVSGLYTATYAHYAEMAHLQLYSVI